MAGFEVALFQKHFKGYIFCFLGHSVSKYIFELFARETNLKKKRSVRECKTGLRRTFGNGFEISRIFYIFLTMHVHTTLIMCYLETSDQFIKKTLLLL